MIVKTYSDIRIRAFLEGKQAELDNGEVCVVAIKGSAESYAVAWHPNVLQLCFDEHCHSTPINGRDMTEPPGVQFSEEHVLKLRDFFSHVRHLKRCRVLAINCSKGISRSGAIAAYASTYFGIPNDVFYRHNRNISPNPWVLRVLGLNPEDVFRRLTAGQLMLEKPRALA